MSNFAKKNFAKKIFTKIFAKHFFTKKCFFPKLKITFFFSNFYNFFKNVYKIFAKILLHKTTTLCPKTNKQQTNKFLKQLFVIKSKTFLTSDHDFVSQKSPNGPSRDQLLKTHLSRSKGAEPPESTCARARKRL